MRNTELCKYYTSTKSSFVVFTTGSAIISHALAPRGLAEGIHIYEYICTWVKLYE